MTDVRLTATNPEDSTVVPVACNARGELLIEGPGEDFLPLSGGNLTGDLTLGTDKITLDASTGDGVFAKRVTADHFTAEKFSLFNGVGTYAAIFKRNASSFGQSEVLRISASDADSVITMNTDGSASFRGDVVIGSRNKQWMIIESNGLAHLVEQNQLREDSSSVSGDSSSGGNEPAAVVYPELRDIPGELTMVEQQLQKVMERLKMAPEAGWEVWDGSD